MTAATEEKTVEEVTFNRSDLVKMFTEYGWKTADSWSDKSIREKLKKTLAKVVKSHRDQELPESEEGKALMESVLAALEDGRKIVFDPLVKEDEKTEETVKPKKKKKKKRKKPAPPRQGMSALDAAEKVLKGSKKPLSSKELVEKMTEKGYWTSPGGKTPQDTVKASILMEIKKKGKASRFAKPEPGRFTLNK